MKRDGTPRKDNAARNVERSVAAAYRERWDLLEHAANQAPVWLPGRVFEWAAPIGLPDGHPGLVVPTDGVVRPAAPGWLVAPG